MTAATPEGFRSWATHLGLSDESRDDFAVVVSDRPCTASVVFTKSLFAGACVTLSKNSVSHTAPRGVVVLAKNANVATGSQGLRNAEEIRDVVAATADVPPDALIMASTGVIGVQYPMATIRGGLTGLGDSSPLDAHAVASAIMTTDTRAKVAVRVVGASTIVGIAKGVGMIEPDMATMLSFVFTDAAIPRDALDLTFRDVVDRTYNSVSIDTDTSTSDTAAIFANGAAGPVPHADFAEALEEVCTDLVKMIASDGEGATKLIVTTVSGASSERQARVVGKAIINSPLIKTMIHGEDPNWGRILMAIGKCSDETDIEQDKIRVAFADIVVFPSSSHDEQANADNATAVRRRLAASTVEINVDLGIGTSTWTVYGCDLTDGYIRINADYTT